MSPAAKNSAPAIIALRPLIFSAKILKTGFSMPHARFWIAIARLNSARIHPNSDAMGI